MSISRTSQKQIRILTCRQDVESLRSFWTACPTHRDADIDFFLFIGDLFPSVLRPHVVVLYDGSEPLAVLVARLEISRVPIKIGYWSLPSPEMRVLQISGWLGQTEKYAQVLAQSLSRSLKEGEADVACFRYIDRNSALAQHARTAVSRPFSDVSKVFHSHWYCDRKDNETFLQGLSRNQRAQQRRRERKIARAFDTHRIELFCSAEQIGKLIQDVEQVARKSYQRRLNVGFSDSAEVRARLEFDAAKGWLGAYVLYFDERPCAFWIGSLRNGSFLSNYLAFDPAYSRYSPGMYLVIKVMEALSIESDRFHANRIDFGVGDATYKERLSNRRVREALLYIFAPRLTPLLANLARVAAQCLNNYAKKLDTLSLQMRFRMRESRCGAGET